VIGVPHKACMMVGAPPAENGIYRNIVSDMFE
jgi:hypothetical protein